MSTLNEITQVYKAEHRIRQIVYTIYNHVLTDYIARSNEKEVLNRLFEFYKNSDIVLISKQQLKIYEELEKNIIDLNLTGEL